MENLRVHTRGHACRLVQQLGVQLTQRTGQKAYLGSPET